MAQLEGLKWCHIKQQVANRVVEVTFERKVFDMGEDVRGSLVDLELAHTELHALDFGGVWLQGTLVR